MAGSDDVMDLTRPRPSIREMLSQATARAQPEIPPPPAPAPPPPEPVADEFEPLPGPGDAYKAHARPSNKPLMTLHCLLAGAKSRGFAWATYDGIDLEPAGSAGAAPLLVLRFSGREAADVVIEGRNLAQLHAYLGQGRVGWIRELPAGKDFGRDREPVITGIRIRSVTE